ncbi:MAG: penicillin-binding transpeptidase domain-containing protein [Cellulosilyticaceae bacterium]
MKNNKTIYTIATVFIVIFSALTIYMAYFTIVKSKSIAIHPYNRRLDHLEDEVIRGTIYDENGKVLAETIDNKRNYPYGNTFAHAVGYSQRGKYGIEAIGNIELIYPDYTIPSLFAYAFNNEKFQSYDVVTTLNANIQQAAAKALGNKKGAAIVMEPTTGKIIAMYSSPAFDPNTIKEDWEKLSSDKTNSPLLNRATQGLYPPASVFKIITTIAYLTKDAEGDFEYTCTGKFVKGEHTIACYNDIKHGNVDLKNAFAKSCNTYFLALSEKVDEKQLQNTAEKLLFNKSLSDQLQHKISSINLLDDTVFDALASYIGQGKVLVSPFHMAILASVIYNDGVLMNPYIIDYSMNKNGKVHFKNLPQYSGALLDETISQKIKDLMINVVENGTGKRTLRKDLEIGGKTGTAQNETGIDHSWFVGFADKKDGSKNPITFAVIVEQGGQGAQALDITNSILNACFD